MHGGCLIPLHMKITLKPLESWNKNARISNTIVNGLVSDLGPWGREFKMWSAHFLMFTLHSTTVKYCSTAWMNGHTVVHGIKRYKTLYHPRFHSGSQRVKLSQCHDSTTKWDLENCWETTWQIAGVVESHPRGEETLPVASYYRNRRQVPLSGGGGCGAGARRNPLIRPSIKLQIPHISYRSSGEKLLKYQ